MGWSSKAMQWLEKIMYAAVLNLLWLAGVLLGLGLFGIFPATFALFNLLHNKALFESQSPILPIVKQFFSFYGRFFLKANLAGAVYLGSFYLLAVDWQIIRYQEMLQAFFSFPLILLGVYLLETLIFLAPIMILSAASRREKLKLALLAPLLLPKTSVLNIVVLLGLLYLASAFSAGLFLFYIALAVFCWDRLCSASLQQKRLVAE